MPLEAFHYLTRIHYKSENVPVDGRWGEHEIDYVLVIRRNVDVEANWNEVKSYRYVDKQELKDLIGKLSLKHSVKYEIDGFKTRIVCSSILVYRDYK